MNDILIPMHVIQRLERRWSAKLDQLARMRTRSQWLWITRNCPKWWARWRVTTPF